MRGCLRAAVAEGARRGGGDNRVRVFCRRYLCSRKRSRCLHRIKRGKRTRARSGAAFSAGQFPCADGYLSIYASRNGETGFIASAGGGKKKQLALSSLLRLSDGKRAERLPSTSYFLRRAWSLELGAWSLERAACSFLFSRVYGRRALTWPLVERIAHKSRTPRQAAAWEIAQYRQMTPAERIRVARALRRRAYPSPQPDVRACHGRGPSKKLKSRRGSGD